MNKLVLHKLNLINFRNYQSAEALFSERFNCLAGANGQGKTNLLDAIHYLSFTKSYFNPIDSQNILHDQPMFVVQGQFQWNSDKAEVYVAQKKAEKKVVRVNKEELGRLADHIGRFPVVMASPTDIELIYEGSDIRRRFADAVISQYDAIYLEDLISYTKALAQRNAQLKQFARSGQFQMDVLEIWDEQLSGLGQRIYDKRVAFSKEFEPIFQSFYKRISGGSEKVSMNYRSQLQQGDMHAQLNEALEKDRALEYTTVGIHKDDWEFRLSDYPVKKFGSQGQQRSYLLSVKLAQFEFTRVRKNLTPILMLDDLYDKLDDQRVERLVKLISEPEFGQVFITATDPVRIRKLFKDQKDRFKLFLVESGELRKEK